MKSRVEIRYCTGCRWLLRAAWTAQELLVSFEEELTEVALVPAQGGVFEVRADGKLLWSRSERGRFPELRELKQRLRDRIAPGRSLGHSDRASEVASEAEDASALRELEEALWRRERRFDPAWMRERLAPSFREVGRSGRSYDREEVLAIPDQQIDAVLPLPDLEIHVLHPDLAQVRYRSVVTDSTGTQHAHRSSTWRRVGGRWQLLYHQGTAIPDPD